ncbi:uncharacterized protein AMSG_04685 [Thecamonas trahens ATCC 50062]|uniref:UBC core domain-containing protein n=1 Tax=Thecamonas trahens ATCC 50062 TaxID=461836 RepID=A0A0L0D9L6_THETB|nr:hypothetical protein AMSG_04685 [Thecamonas trahens ATCC 50062]KNC48940.1 hypothetical protein AMSG_04685 [Thecamonas trahens ATCC 50062]|eukprot:XP_013758357.1 hypothetical protein AMSG_04685 [Thecamonas trahens ATCC 50062]
MNSILAPALKATDPLFSVDNVRLAHAPAVARARETWDVTRMTLLRPEDSWVVPGDGANGNIALVLVPSPQLYLDSAGGIAFPDPIQRPRLAELLAWAQNLTIKDVVDDPRLSLPALGADLPSASRLASEFGVGTDNGGSFESIDALQTAVEAQLSRPRRRLFNELAFGAYGLAPWLELLGVAPGDDDDAAVDTAADTSDAKPGPSSDAASGFAKFKAVTAAVWTLVYHPSKSSVYAGGGPFELSLRLGGQYPLSLPSLHVETPHMVHLHVVDSLSAVHPNAPARRGRIDLERLRPAQWSPTASLIEVFTTVVELFEGEHTGPDELLARTPFAISHDARLGELYRTDRAGYHQAAAASGAVADPALGGARSPGSLVDPPACAAVATACKLAGNAALGRGELATSRALYARGRAWCRQNRSEPELAELYLALELNDSLAAIRDGDARAALASANAALAAAPLSTKALYRRAKAHAALGDDELAIADLERAVALAPNDAALARELARARKAKARAKAEQAALYRRALGGS